MKPEIKSEPQVKLELTSHELANFQKDSILVDSQEESKKPTPLVKENLLLKGEDNPDYSEITPSKEDVQVSCISDVGSLVERNNHDHAILRDQDVFTGATELNENMPATNGNELENIDLKNRGDLISKLDESLVPPLEMDHRNKFELNREDIAILPEQNENQEVVLDTHQASGLVDEHTIIAPQNRKTIDDSGNYELEDDNSDESSEKHTVVNINGSNAVQHDIKEGDIHGIDFDIADYQKQVRIHHYDYHAR